MQGPSGRHGQNGFGGWGGQWRAEQAVQAWYDEVKDYNFSYGGFSMNTGHFTQLVWRETVKVQSFDIPNIAQWATIFLSMGSYEKYFCQKIFVLKLQMAGGDGPLPLW